MQLKAKNVGSAHTIENLTQNYVYTILYTVNKASTYTLIYRYDTLSQRLINVSDKLTINK